MEIPEYDKTESDVIKRWVLYPMDKKNSITKLFVDVCQGNDGTKFVRVGVFMLYQSFGSEGNLQE